MGHQGYPWGPWLLVVLSHAVNSSWSVLSAPWGACSGGCSILCFGRLVETLVQHHLLWHPPTTAVPWQGLATKTRGGPCWGSTPMGANVLLGVLHFVLWPSPLPELWGHLRTWVSLLCLRHTAPIALCSAPPANSLPSRRDPHGPSCSSIFWPCGGGPSGVLWCGDTGCGPSTCCCHCAWWDSCSPPLRGAQHELHLESPAW